MATKPAERHQELCARIAEHDYRYYVLDQPQISDREYDALFGELKALEARYPELVTPTSPSQRVGEQPREGVTKAEHAQPMYSLDNTYNEDELREFDRRVRGGLKSATRVRYVVEPKLDGASIEVIFRQGALYAGITRGDGRLGEDVTANVRTIRSLPLSIDDKRPLTLRGEVVIFRRDLEAINEQRNALGEEPFANPRNAAAGSLRLLDAQLAAQRPLRLFLYELVERYYSTHSQALKALKTIGLPTHTLEQTCENIDEVLSYVDRFAQKRKDLSFETDGVVVKVDDLAQRDVLGATARFPRWAIAYKYQAERVTTRVREIACDVGRTGVLTPVAVLEPVQLSGTVVSRASLHNVDYVKEKDVRVGDSVVIEKAGEIIPQVVAVDRDRRPRDAEPWMAPKCCPACDTPVTRTGEEVALRCVNASCPGKIKASVLYFTRRSAMDIEHIGRSLVDQLVDSEIVSDVADIFALKSKRQQLLDLDRMAEKSVDNILDAVENARKTRTFAQLLTALGIPLVGAVAASTLAETYRNLEGILERNEEELRMELSDIRGIGPKIASSVASYFADPKARIVLKKLIELGVETSSIKSELTAVEGPLRGASFCITGVLSRPRGEVQKLIRAAGGEVHDRVKQDTTYLVAGENVGKSKTDAAQKRGVKILTERELEMMMGR
jgi:DNA ligase (NAD+)